MVRILATLLSISLIFTFCTQEKPLPSGFENLQRDKKEGVFVKTIPAHETATYWTAPKAGLSSTLLLGSYNETQSYLVMRFSLSSTDDNLTIQSANMILRQKYHYGEDSNFDVNIYPLTAEWDEEEVVWADIENSYDPANPVGSFNINSADSTISGIDLPADLVNTWLDDATNYGILLKSENASFLSELNSSDGIYTPAQLAVVVNDGEGNVDNDTVFVWQDASLIQYQSGVEENTLFFGDELRVGNTSGFKSLLRFDLSDIPEAANVNQAQITFYADTLKSETTREDISMTSVAVSEDDSIWVPATIEFDETAWSNIAMNSSQETLKFTISVVVQKWLLGQKNNGIILRSSDLSVGATVAEIFFHSGTQDSTLAPQLRITYSVPPENKFETAQ